MSGRPPGRVPRGREGVASRERGAKERWGRRWAARGGAGRWAGAAVGFRHGSRAQGLAGVPAFDSAGSGPLICFRGRTCARGEHAAAGARAARGAAGWAFGLPETRPHAARSRAVARGAAERAPRAGGRGRSRPPGDCGDGRWTCPTHGRIQRRSTPPGAVSREPWPRVCVPRVARVPGRGHEMRQSPVTSARSSGWPSRRASRVHRSLRLPNS